VQLGHARECGNAATPQDLERRRVHRPAGSFRQLRSGFAAEPLERSQEA